MKFKDIFLMGTLICLINGLVSCNDNDATKSFEVKIASPSKAPAIALYSHLTEENVEINSAANNVVGYLTNNSDKDMVIVPTNAGINAIVKQNANFKIAATVTFGNFFLISTGKDTDSTLNSGDKVLAFQETNVAGKLYQYVYGDKGATTTYLSDVGSVRNEILTNSYFDNEYDYVFIAQPDLSEILTRKTQYRVYSDVQKDYKTKTNGKEITQASIFVKNTSDKEKIIDALNTIKNDVEALLKDPNKIETRTKDVEDEVFSGKLGTTKANLKQLINDDNQIGIGFKKASENKASIDSFISTLGLEATDEKIYFNY